MTYLADTSALVRIYRRQVPIEWQDTVHRGMVAVCEPVLAETLKIADAAGYPTLEDELCGIYPWVPVPDNVWDRIPAIRRELAARGAHQGPSVADLVVAATAVRLKLTVLHEDADFSTVARFIPELREKRVSTAP
jgi:predicted nucleic acid-binding protein